MARRANTKRLSKRPKTASPKPSGREIPQNVEEEQVAVDGGIVKVTNLRKVFWPELGLTKRDLLQYYLDVSPWLLPHLKDRAMVMKRYPNGIAGEFFDHFTGGRFRHGTGFLRWRPEKAPRDCTMKQVKRESQSALGLL